MLGAFLAQDLALFVAFFDLMPVLARELAGSSGASPGSQEVGYALAVWNALADPREILDQYATLGWSGERIADALRRAAGAAISGSSPRDRSRSG